MERELSSLLKKKTIRKLQVVQRAMERAMLEVILPDRIPRNGISIRIEIIDVVVQITTLKW